ncbi:hypothetical protein GW17_00057685 [Ensete ventricosum]|nr:hypothetical protein GW17_00057685 [Ensete ventricosum]
MHPNYFPLSYKPKPLLLNNQEPKETYHKGTHKSYPHGNGQQATSTSKAIPEAAQGVLSGTSRPGSRRMASKHVGHLGSCQSAPHHICLSESRETVPHPNPQSMEPSRMPRASRSV